MCHAASRLCVFFPGSEQAAKMVSMEIWCQWCLLAARCHCAATTRALGALRHAHTMRNPHRHCLCLACLASRAKRVRRIERAIQKTKRGLSHASDKPALQPCMRSSAPCVNRRRKTLCANALSCRLAARAVAVLVVPTLSALPVALPGTCSWSQCDAIGEEADCLQGTHLHIAQRTARATWARRLTRWATQQAAGLHIQAPTRRF